MKYENDYIRVIIEKKQLTEEQKEAQKKKRKKRMPYMVTALVLVAAILAGALYFNYHGAADDGLQASVQDSEKSGSSDGNNSEGNDGDVISNQGDQDDIEEEDMWDFTYVSSTRLASSIQEKYQDNSLYGYTYGEPIEDLGRNEAIEIAIEYNPDNLKVEYWYEIYGVYQDPELTQRVTPRYSYDEDNKTIVMAPPNYGINRIGASSLDTETVNKYQHSQYTLFDNGDGTSWGNLGTLYMASYYDAKTGKKLKQPEVSIITLKGELETPPSLSYSILDDGRPQFTWTKVPGAEEYFVCQVDYEEEKGYGISMQVIGVTSETGWVGEAPDYGSYSNVNKEFKTFTVSEDEWKNESSYDYYKEKYEPGKVVLKDYSYGAGICVIAVSQDGTSMISNTFLNSELAPNLPYSTAYNTERENGFSTRCDTIEEVPAYDYVTMCDGITNMKMIDYQTEEAVVSVNHFMLLDDNGEFTGSEDIPCLEIPYVVEGTPFSYTMQVLDYDESNLEKDLKFIEDREEKIRKKSGDISLEADIELEEENETEASEVDVRQVKDIEIFANSALTEYLAVNMLGGATYIDISDFPEAKDTSFVEDALLEAYYQNPLILGLKGYRVNRKGTAVRVSYDESEKDQARKQEEIKNKVTEIISQIITDNMTDEERELAINQYLCDTIEYDEDALANAEENDFMYVDEAFNDSFTAYGALLNGKCVCAGYAAAFKLLADAAGLESIVVTGVLDGSLSHAWNKVNIDGEWQIVDVTNNDNEYIFNALLNLPANVGDRVLVEDKDYMLDKLMSEYTGESEEYEYYHMTDSYFPEREIAERLAEDLEQNGHATLRTDYDLNDEQFYQITDSIFEIMGDDIELYGYYWLGVIYLSTSVES